MKQFCQTSFKNGKLSAELTASCQFVLRFLQSIEHASCTAPATECASRNNGVHFFDISTSKSGPGLVCFVHFHFEMYFVPQRRALFRHLNFQKWSENGVFCTFCLGDVLCATTACIFFISHLARWPRTRRFSEPTFRSSGATNHWKNTVFPDFPTFCPSASSFF